MNQKNQAYSEMLSALARKTRDAGLKPIGGYSIQETLDAQIDAQINAQRVLNAQLSYKPGTLLTAEMVRKVCFPPELTMGYGKDLRDDKLDALSYGTTLHKKISDYIALAKAPPPNLYPWQEQLLEKIGTYPSLSTTNQEPAMTTIKIETKTFVTAPGFKDIDVTKLTPGDLAVAINSIDGEIARFETLSVKPASVIAHIAQLKQGLADLIAAVDKVNPSVPQPTE